MPLNHTSALVTIAAPNFDRLVDFYKALFTQEPIAFIPTVYAEFQLPGLKLGIYHPKANPEPQTPNSELKTQNSKLKTQNISHGDAKRTKLKTPNSKLTSSHSALIPPISLCLEVIDLEAAIAHLTDLGYPPPGKILTASHGREIYAADADGNRLILHQGFG